MDGTGIALLFSGAATDDQVPNACDVWHLAQALSQWTVGAEKHSIQNNKEYRYSSPAFVLIVRSSRDRTTPANRPR